MASKKSGALKPRPIRERFDTAVEVIRSLPKEGPFQTSNTQKLRFYSLFKQAKEGPCNIPKPSFWDTVGRAKWEGWTVCGNMKKETAMQLYVEELQQFVEAMPQTKEVEEFLKSIGPFYEVVEEEEEEDKEEEEGEGEEEEEGEREGELSPVTEAKDPSFSESPLRQPHPQPRPPGPAGGGDAASAEGAGESDVSDSESSSSEDFQESFQDLPPSSSSSSSFSGPPRRNASEGVETEVPSSQTTTTYSTPPLLSPATSHAHLASEDTDLPTRTPHGASGRQPHTHRSAQPLSSRHAPRLVLRTSGPVLDDAVTSPVQVNTRPRLPRGQHQGPGFGRTALGGSERPSIRSDSLGLPFIPEEEVEEGGGGGGGGRGGGGASTSRGRVRSSRESVPTVDVSVDVSASLEAVNSQIATLHQSLETMLHQLNTTSLAVRAIRLATQNGSPELPSSLRSHRSSWWVWFSARLRPFLILWPLFVGTVMYYLCSRFSRGDLNLPPWIWGVLAVFQMVSSLLLSSPRELDNA